MEYRDEVYFAGQVEAEPPFPAAEFAGRCSRIRDRMAAAGIDCLVLSAPESMFYVSGYQCEWYQAQSPPQWPAASCTVLHVDHEQPLHFDTEREAALGRITATGVEPRLFPRTALRGGAAYVADELAQAGWLRGRVGLELWSYRPNRVLSEAFQIALEAHGARVVDATFLVREERWLKSPLELAAIREAATIADVGMTAARSAIQVGVTELEVYGELVRALARAGGENTAITQPVLSGPKTVAAHALSSRRRIGADEVVTVDCSGVRHRYHANLARTFFTGEPPDDIAAVAALAAASIEVVRPLLRPGLPFRELSATVRAYYEDAGLWGSRGWIGGYEMGIAFYGDWVGNVVWDPLSDVNADRVFAPGTAVNIETQIFLPRHQGLFFAIDTLIFDADRAEVASTLPVPLGKVGW